MFITYLSPLRILDKSWRHRFGSISNASPLTPAIPMVSSSIHPCMPFPFIVDGDLLRPAMRKSKMALPLSERVGIFTLIANGAAAPDGQVLLTVTTVVHVHNWLGLYMLPVTPLHRLIAPSVLKSVGRRRAT
jgi:hypothetical protein